MASVRERTEEGALCRQLGFGRAGVHIFRERTTRRNIQYRVELVQEAGLGRKGRRGRGKGGGDRVKGEDAVARRVCAIVRKWMSTHRTGKVIVYGGTIERVQDVAADLARLFEVSMRLNDSALDGFVIALCHINAGLLGMIDESRQIERQMEAMSPGPARTGSGVLLSRATASGYLCLS